MESIKTTGTITATIITNKDRSKCFAIERTLQEAQETGKAIIFGMFPTMGSLPCDAYSVDKTTKHLLDHMKELELKSVIMVNLFSKICRGHKMSSRNLKVDSENIEFIENIFKKKDIKDYKIIMSFGSSMGSSYACKETQRTILNLIDMYELKDQIFQFTTGNLSTNNQTAVHLLYLGIRHPNSKWRLEPFLITTEILEGQTGKKASETKPTQTSSNVKNIRKKGD